MNQQVIIELMNLLGAASISFDDLKVKMSPHSFPYKITRVSIENRMVHVEVNGEVTEFEKCIEPVRNTIGMRLRIILMEKSKPIMLAEHDKQVNATIVEKP